MAFGPLTLDVVAQQAYLNGMDLLLPPKRFALLRLFIEHANETMNAAYLYEEVWKTPMNADDRAVRFQISQLRSELNGSGYTVTNKRGEGYCFEKE
jgi:DNA-binding response OmpR family regulator